MKKNGVFLFVISHLHMTIWKSKHKIENISASNTAIKLKLSEHVIG